MYLINHYNKNSPRFLTNSFVAKSVGATIGGAKCIITTRVQNIIVSIGGGCTPLI